MLEHSRWHVWMTNQVVRRTNQLIAAKATDLDKGVIAVADLAFEVSGRNQPLLGWKSAFTLGNRLIVAHDGGNPLGRHHIVGHCSQKLNRECRMYLGAALL
jgi:hypothetical protein